MRALMRMSALLAALLVTTLVGIELVARGLLSISGSREEIARRLVDATLLSGPGLASLPNAGRVLEADEVVHPYVGYVLRPEKAVGSETLSLDALGFAGGGDFVTEPDPRRLVVGVFGGSVAKQFSAAGGPQRMLRDFAGDREIVVATVAMGGYKQPQALLAFDYLLALGMHFDVVLLIDGLNEVVLPLVENANQGAFPFFPRLWAWRVASLDLATDVRSLIGEIAFRRDLRQSIARSLENSPLRHSGFVSLLWMILDRRMSAAIEARRVQVQELRPKSLDYLATGPAWPTSGPDLVQDLAEVWMRSARQMYALARDQGILFAHFLQPNQYVAGSKPFSAEESEHFVLDQHPYRKAVERGYPQLQIALEKLRAAGVPSHSLIDVFAATQETVYSDDCCHLNQRGNDILADAISALFGAATSSPTAGH
jgi:hypothetical protein